MKEMQVVKDTCWACAPGDMWRVVVLETCPTAVLICFDRSRVVGCLRLWSM